MRKILITDDDEIVRNFYARAIKMLKYKTLTAKNGEEALETIRSELPDLLLTDTEMGQGMTGYELCRIIKQDPKTSNIKVIGMTGNGNGYKKNYEEAKADGYLTKPSTLEEIESVLEKVLKED